MAKLITFTVPCYNSAEYMDHCIETLLSAGEEAEIILVDDGSAKDDTPEKCDRWAEQYPNIVKAIHKENGGHGSGVDAGIANATGTYFKVVDSDDWLDTDALKRVLDKLREFAHSDDPVDMLAANYVYEHVQDNTRKVMGYTNAFPANRVFTWEDTHPFLPSQCLLMHSVIYRTALVKQYHRDLPKHTFYVDNVYVYQILPYAKSMYYMNEDLYRYYIGRADQSVNEKVMASRVDHQFRVTKIMIHTHDVSGTAQTNPKLARYMKNFMSMMMTVASIFSVIAGTQEALEGRDQLWQELKAADPGLYRYCRCQITNFFTNLPGKEGRKTSVALYRLAQKLFKFN